MKYFLFVFLLVLSTLSFASSPKLPSPQIRSINIFSGTPQPSDEGPVKTGGFGDVAANVVAAIEAKNRYPDLLVRLLVTSAKTRYEPQVLTSNEIMKIMIPDINPDNKGIVQRYQGVEIIFLDTDLSDVLKDENYIKLRYRLWRHSKRLERLVPNADLNLNFSYYTGAAPLLMLNAPLAMAVEEVAGSHNLINHVIARGEGQGPGAFVELSSGPRALGFMLNRKITTAPENLKMIHNWASHHELELRAESKFLFAYSADWRATQVYIDAISTLDLEGDYIFFVKPFADLDMSALPPNIRVVAMPAVPFEIMRALIQESALSPLVTGDISWGQALSSTTPTKTFVYESPWWKLESSARMRGILARNTNTKQRRLAEMFLMTETLERLDRRGLRQHASGLARILIDQQLQQKLHHAIISHQTEWDVLDGALNIAQGLLEQQPFVKASTVEYSGPLRLRATVKELQSRLVPHLPRRIGRFFSHSYYLCRDALLDYADSI